LRDGVDGDYFNIDLAVVVHVVDAAVASSLYGNHLSEQQF